MPKDGSIRPTTDRAKESLFNILIHQWDFAGCRILDLFAGSGNIGLEFLSRGAQRVMCVEKNPKVASQLKSFADQHSMEQLKVLKQDAFRFIRNTEEKFHIVFADPPYHLPEIRILPEAVFDNNLLETGGLLIIEHPSQLSWTHQAYQSSRKYGQSMFSFFSN